MTIKPTVAFSALLATVFFTAMASASTLTPTYQGRYVSLDSTTGFNQTNGVQSAGQGQISFHAFDISGLGGVQVNTATFRFKQEGAINASAFPLLIFLREVDVPFTLLLPDRLAPNPTSLSLFLDMAAGEAWGSRSIDVSTDGTIIDIILNTDGIAALQSKINSAQQYFVFSESNYVPNALGYFQVVNASLVINEVPEPGSLPLLILGAVWCACLKTRRCAALV